jgi:hypothetical protein
VAAKRRHGLVVPTRHAFGYRIALGQRRTIDLFGEVFNLTDRANFANPAGDRRSTNFLLLTALRAGGIPRTGQIGVRIGF